MNKHIEKIISGGQTGVDRAALDFALQRNIPCGGWCPKGRLAEDGRIDEKYPLEETKTSLYQERTRLNVKDSDGTLILYSGEMGNGTVYTAEYARQIKKPLLIVNTGGHGLKEAILQWIESHQVKTLNIAGPRESTLPGIYKLTIQILNEVLG